jgi:hypothetical protein
MARTGQRQAETTISMEAIRENTQALRAAETRLIVGCFSRERVGIALSSYNMWFPPVI